jgi:hypothetical protein
MIELDLATSTLLLDGTRLPAVGLLCPAVPGIDDDLDDWHHLLGCVESSDLDVWVPAENGTAFNLTVYKWTISEGMLAGAKTMHLAWYDLRRTVRDDCPTDAGFIPPLYKSWSDCEVDWTLETIERLGRRAAPASYPLEHMVIEEGPPAKLLSLAEVARIWEEHRERV